MIDTAYILLRTSNRPKFFKVCMESIKAQDYPNIVTIVHTDDPKDDYVEGDIIIKGERDYQARSGFYNLYNARVIAFNQRSMNPYLVGSKIFEDIEDRWNRGCFGREWDECNDNKSRKNWNKNLGQGRAKVFEVRRSYSDWFFMDHFLTEEIVDKLDLYIYQAQEYGNEIRWVIVEKDWKVIKELITRSLSHFGIPKIMVEDGDFGGRTELYLRHHYDGMPLDQEYVRRTMEHIYYLWNRPVHLETVKKEMNKDQRKLLTYNGSAHLEVNL